MVSAAAFRAADAGATVALAKTAAAAAATAVLLIKLQGFRTLCCVVCDLVPCRMGNTCMPIVQSTAVHQVCAAQAAPTWVHP